tara:strand:+ start:14816 stop:15949 length:1134 start_codon:yes stop_codon:yes gene_type:complete
MKKILFLGRVAGVYKTNRADLDFIADELINEGHELHIYDPKYNILKNLSNNHIRKVGFLKNIKKPRSIQRLISFMNLIFFCIKFKGAYDIVQINYVREEYLVIPRLVSKLGKEFKVFIYGDDLNLRNWIKNKFTKLYYVSDEIILTNKLIFEKNRNYFSKPDSLEKKMKYIYLPQVQLKNYEHFKYQDKIKAKDKMGLKGQKVVLCGISSHPNEQHDKIIEGISNLNNQLNYHFLFPLSTREADNSEWIAQIKLMAEKNLDPKSYTYIEGYKTIEEVAQYRLASDIMINLRKRDQLNAALIESNYSFCQIICGSWLPYDDYWSEFRTEKIDDHLNLAEKIEFIFKDDELEQKLKYNREKAEDNYSYRVVDKWLKLYK